MRSTTSLDNLYLSDLNVRKTDRALDIEPLADTMIAHGVIGDLVVTDEGKGKGLLGVVAGGRRWQALVLIVGRGDWSDRLPPRDAIPFKQVPLEEARELSLAENIHTVAMNPADEFEAFAEIIADYESLGEQDPQARVERCARHFGKTVRYVEQRLRLAGLAPDIFAALRSGAISIDVAKAYASVADLALQMRIFADQEVTGKHRVAAIRLALANSTYRRTDRQVIYVGVEAYLAAGGRIDQDLFMGAELGDALIDTALLDRLCLAKAEPEAQRLAADGGYGAAMVQPWGASSWLFPKVPDGFEKTAALQSLSAEQKAEAILLCQIPADGSGLVATASGFKPVQQVPIPLRSANGSAAPLPAAVRAPESEIEQLGRIRREKIQATALRLAMPSFDSTPFEDRAFWPKQDLRSIAPVMEEDDCFVVALLIKVPKIDVARVMGEAEALVDHEETRRANPPAPAPAAKVMA